LPTKSPRLYKLEEKGYDGVVKNPGDSNEVTQKKVQAMTASFEWGDKIPIGVFYKIEEPTFEDMLANRIPGFKAASLVKQDLFSRNVDNLFQSLT